MLDQQQEVQTNKPVTYSVHVGIKTPSRIVQYRMLDASVTVTGEDRDDVMAKAVEALTFAIANVAIQFGEAPPDEIRSDLEHLWGPEVTDQVYESADDSQVGTLLDLH